MNTFTLPIAKTYAGKIGIMGTFRSMTIAEAKVLAYGEHVWFRANDGQARRLKINGAPKVWKTRPNDVSVPVKYGLYEYDRMNAQEVESRLLVEVS